MATCLSITLWLVVSVFAVAGVVLSFGGIGSIHADCKKFNDDNGATVVYSDDECDDKFRPIWWAILFGAVTMILTLLMGVAKQLGKTRALIMVLSFVVLSTADLMDAVETTLVFNDDKIWEDIDGEEDSLRVGITGLLGMTVANWLIIIVTTLFMDVGVPGPLKGTEAAAPLA